MCAEYPQIFATAAVVLLAVQLELENTTDPPICNDSLDLIKNRAVPCLV